MSDTSVDFSVLCSMLEAIARVNKATLKRKHLRTFLDHVYTDREFFSAMRLILPGLDKERGTYGLKEAILAKCIADALGLAKDSEDAKMLVNWRRGGAQTGANVGNFLRVAAEVIFRRQSTSSGGLKIKAVNEYLDRLASAESREEKTAILADLITKTNTQEMKWILAFILKDPKLGISEKTILHEFHPDAEDLFNVTCDLKLVCEKLKDRSQRYNRQDIEVGKPIRPQLATRVADAEGVWRQLRGKQIIAECKFDGDRIQIHKNGTDVHFFSRTFIDHKEYREATAGVIRQQVKVEKCILDGEMLVWNKTLNRFAEFGSNQGAAKAAAEGLKTDQQLCYVAFDILYAGDSSVIHRGLHERHALLRQCVQPLKGSLELLLPDHGVSSPGLSITDSDQPCWSMLVHNVDEIDKFFLKTVENRDEGIVLKDLDSKWEPGDRSSRWLKLKPDYIHSEKELDALIIGCYFGSGRLGGEVGQFLLGLAERPKFGGHPTRFFSFCKVGTGLTDNERNDLVSKLKPYLRKYEKNSKPPSFYTVTNSAKERPDFWVSQPDKSMIVEVTSDIRTIKSEVFATPYSLRFPRIHRIRYDKPWYDCLDVQSLVDMVSSTSGNTVNVQAYDKKDRSKGSQQKKSVQLMTVVPSHMLVTDISHVKQKTFIFKGLVFYFINVHPQSTKDSFHKLVVENGGSFSMNLNDSVTHAIAAEKKGIRYQAAAVHKDIIHESWVTDCCLEKKLLPLRPKYFLHLSMDSGGKINDEMDEFGDDYVYGIDVTDLKQLFQNMDTIKLSASEEEIFHYQKKYWQAESFSLLFDCCIYFCSAIHCNIPDPEIAKITMKRLELEVLMHGGKLTNTLKDATHMIIYASGDQPLPYSSKNISLTSEERKAFKSPKAHVVKHFWLEEVFFSNRRLPEQAYSFRDGDVDSENEDKQGKTEITSRAGKLRKRSHPTSKGVESSSETDDITPRRQLYSSKDNQTKSKAKSLVQKDVG